LESIAEFPSAYEDEQSSIIFIDEINEQTEEELFSVYQHFHNFIENSQVGFEDMENLILEHAFR
jgi:hypothetical protein